MSDKASKENCAGDYPALWRIKYKFDQRIVRSVYGTGEVETVGMQIAEGQYDVVAMTPGLARETFNKFGPYQPKEPSEPEFICYVDAFCHVGKHYGGHFS
jgi:hypothetical protein